MEFGPIRQNICFEHFNISDSGIILPKLINSSGGPNINLIFIFVSLSLCCLQLFLLRGVATPLRTPTWWSSGLVQVDTSAPSRNTTLQYFNVLFCSLYKLVRIFLLTIFQYMSCFAWSIYKLPNRSTLPSLFQYTYLVCSYQSMKKFKVHVTLTI